jgi:hypothetical protein
VRIIHWRLGDESSLVLLLQKAVKSPHRIKVECSAANKGECGRYCITEICTGSVTNGLGSLT